MDQATEITPNLYLGPLVVARDLAELERLKITAIVCAAAEGRAHFPDRFDYLEMAHLVEHNCDIDDIVSSLGDIVTFYDKQQQQQGGEGKVFVHCVHGRTRSASIVTYLLAKQMGCSIRDAYKTIVQKRDVLIPEHWLEALESKLSFSRRCKKEKK